MIDHKDAHLPKADVVGFDDFLEDLFGLNIRGLKTLWISFRSPRSYYKAATSPNWLGLFTPSFRLFLSLLAIIFLMQFFWGNINSPAVTSYAAQMEAQNIPLPDGISYRQAGYTFSNWYAAFIPPFTILFYLIIGSFYGVWGRKLSFVERQRYLFISVVPDTFISIFLITLLGVIPHERIIQFLLLFPLISFFITAQIAYRGAYLKDSRWSKLWRAGLLAIIIVITAQLASFSAQYAAAKVIQFKYI